LALARDLRAVGLRVELDASGSAFGKQFKRADRSGAHWALVLGDEEAERGEVRLKSLNQQAEECTVAIAPVSAIVERLLTP
jgi:histidyl-tRNA synthetase